MIDIAIDTSDLDAALASAQDMTPLEDAMETGLAWLHADMAAYPGQRSGTRYRRTGNLGRLWTTKIHASRTDIRGELGNAARDRRGRSYGPYVQDAQLQARWNRHWQTDQQVADRNESRIRERFDRALQVMADG